MAVFPAPGSIWPVQVTNSVNIAGSGYLSAFPTEHFDRLQNLESVWAPFYVVRAHSVLIL